MAERLVRDMEADFEPRKYKDSYHDDLLAFIKKKVKAGDTAEIEEPEDVAEPEPSNVVDIMSLLRRSLGKQDEPAAKKKAAKKASKKTARRTATRKTAAKKTSAKKLGKQKSAHKKKAAARHPARRAA
jgi:DNA end-binding protein Ku